MNALIPDMMTPEEVTRLFLALLPGSLFFTVGALVFYLSTHWHADAERSNLVVKHAQRGLLLAFLAGGTTFLFLRITDISGLFGILPTLTLRFEWSHIVAIIVGLSTIWIFLQLYRELLFLPVIGASLTITVIAYCIDAPEAFGIIWLLLCALWLLPIAFLFFRLLPPDPVQLPSKWIQNLFSRGARATSIDQVIDIANRQKPLSSEAPVFFGFQEVAVEAASGHFLITGTSGAGKTISLRLMMQSVLPRIVPGSRQRAVIFDAKREMVSVLGGIGLETDIRILNPFDARCSVWDLARDFKTPADALQLAKMFLPDPQTDGDAFWTKSARGILADLILAHILALRDGVIPHWSLADLIRSLQSKEELEKALALSPQTKDALRNLHEEKIYHGILASLDLVRREFEVLAALWDKPSEDPDRLFSLNEWMEGSGVLVIGPTVTAEEVVNPLNRLIVERLAQLLLDSPDVDPQPGVPKSRTWLFLDEFPRLGRMPRIESLMTNGRSKGLISVLAIQDISDLRKIYGPEYAAIITGACWNKLHFQSPSPEAATWCVDSIGSTEVEQIVHGISFAVTRGTGSGVASTTETTSQTPSEKNRPLFTKEEFLYLGRPGERTPIRHLPRWVSRLSEGFLRTLLEIFYATSRFSPLRAIASVQGRVYRSQLSFTRAVEAMTEKEGRDFAPRPDSAQFLKRWDAPPAVVIENQQAAPALTEKSHASPEASGDLKAALFKILLRTPQKTNKT